MKSLLQDIIDYVLAIIHRITGNRQAMENDFLKQENKMLKRMLKEQEAGNEPTDKEPPQHT